MSGPVASTVTLGSPEVLSMVALGVPKPAAAPGCPSCPSVPVAPRGIVKSKIAAFSVPELFIITSVPGSPVVTLPTVIVAACPSAPSSPLAPVCPVSPRGIVNSEQHFVHRQN